MGAGRGGAERVLTCARARACVCVGAQCVRKRKASVAEQMIRLTCRWGKRDHRAQTAAAAVTGRQRTVVTASASLLSILSCRITSCSETVGFGRWWFTCIMWSGPSCADTARRLLPWVPPPTASCACPSTSPAAATASLPRMLLRLEADWADGQNRALAAAGKVSDARHLANCSSVADWWRSSATCL